MDINSDSWDDDVPDEDLIQAFDQATKASAPQPAVSASRGIGVATTLGRTTAPIRGHINHSNSKNAQSALARSNAAAAIDVDDLPSDAFDSTLETEQAPQVARKPAQSFRQTNLWGEPIRGGRDGRDGRDGKVPGAGAEPRAPASSARLYRADQPAEAPTHHSLNSAALKTWVYPLNLGAIRDYQFSIVKNGLFNNTLVALPTGLGKTFIAATVILNFFRWTCDSKIVFVAPTKPLASQQVDACLNIVGIPRSQTTLLTGETKPVLREEEWETKRLFFMTPQTLQNDLSKGYADPKKIVLLVVDEAHRATGDYAYVKVIEFLRRFSKSFRVLALTATPGSTVEGVQDVIDNLGVSHVEIRTEESIDIRKYVHSRQIDTVVLEPSDEILRLKDLFSKALKPLVGKISQQNIYYGRDPMSINAYGLMKARQDWFNGPGRHVNQGTKSMIMAIFTILQGLAHSIKLLDFHGIRPFYDYLASFRSETEEKGAKGSKYKRQLINDSSFQEMMDTTAKWLKIDGFVGHPKMTHLCDTLLNHFMDAGAGSTTRVIVFTEYRDSAEEITRVLNIHKPLISASLFVGQADSKKSEGMKQKQQIETIDKFKSGTFNVLVATSIGEEGLDIGQVDLIICYDASSSPIRMLQRMGRTGRKRAGKITLLLMKGKEEDNYLKAQDNYEKMQKLICEGSRFNFRHDLSSRIIPRDIKPEVDKRMVEMPFENTQNTSLPEPKARNTRGKKLPKKKFNMPDGVETGFQMASKFGTTSKSATVPKMTKTKSFPEPEPEPEPEPLETDSMAELPDLDSVLLDTKQARELNRLYRDLPFYDTALEEIATPSLTAHPHLQRSLRPTAKLGHGSYTKRCVRLFKKLGMSQSVAERDLKRYGKHDLSSFRGIPVPSFADENSSSKYDRDERGGACSASKQSAKTRVEPQRKRRKVAPKTAKPKANATQVSTSYLSDSVNTGSSAKEDEDSDDDELDDDDSLHDFIVNEDEDDRGGRDDARGEDESVLSDEDDIFETAASSSRGMPKSPTSASWRLPASSSMSSISPQPAGKPFSVAGETLATQETNDDDELPSLDDLLGGRPARGGLPLEKGDRVQDRGMDADKDGDEDIILKTRPKKRSRYAFVEESDSD